MSKKENEIIDISSSEYDNYLSKEVKYSLEVDPQNLYNLKKVEKEFIKAYVNYKNIGIAAEIAKIDLDMAKTLWLSFPAQEEIRRINRALYHYQFSTKLLSLEDIGGYLSSLITGENVPEVDQLKTPEKLRVVDMLINLQLKKENVFNNPNILMVQNFENDVKKLSVNAIENLLNINFNNENVEKKQNEKEEIIDLLPYDNLTPEEIAFLKSLPVEELLKLIEELSDNKEKSKTSNINSKKKNKIKKGEKKNVSI